jgi:hypothetical protein
MYRKFDVMGNLLFAQWFFWGTEHSQIWWCAKFLGSAVVTSKSLIDVAMNLFTSWESLGHVQRGDSARLYVSFFAENTLAIKETGEAVVWWDDDDGSCSQAQSPGGGSVVLCRRLQATSRGSGCGHGRIQPSRATPFPRQNPCYQMSSATTALEPRCAAAALEPRSAASAGKTRLRPTAPWPRWSCGSGDGCMHWWRRGDGRGQEVADRGDKYSLRFCIPMLFLVCFTDMWYFVAILVRTMSLKLDDMYLATVQVIESDFFSPQMSSF